VCGDGACTHAEDAPGCPADCPAVCGDGAITHGEACEGSMTQTCDTTCGSSGSQSCRSCAWGACVPPPESCNGLDDDCSGTIDDGAADCATVTGCRLDRLAPSVYLICAAPTSDWSAASEFCAAYGYHMVTVDSAAENLLIFGGISMSTEVRFWIGLCDVNGDGFYDDDEWEVGSSSYRQWSSGEPDEYGGCVAIRFDLGGDWVSRFGSNGFVCEAP
jgi:hypothetical protein